ncbi:MAG: DNA double-strand break repair nuclease NurA [Nitrososphaerales archaeon]
MIDIMLSNMGIQLSLLDSALLSSGLSSLSGSIKDEISNNLSADLKGLEGRRVIFATSSNRQPLVQWQEGSSTVLPDHIEINHSPTLLSAVDSSIVPICDLADGTLYVSRVAVVFSIGGSPSNYLRLGPFLYHSNGDSRLGLDRTVNDEKLLEAAIRTQMERSAIGHLARFLKGSIILIDGTLRLTSSESSSPGIIQEAKRNNNTLIGISKTSKIQSVSEIASQLRGIYGAPFFCRLNYGPTDSSIYTSVIAKFRDDGVAFRTDILGRDTREALALLAGNDAFYRGYPESLRLAHHLSVFTPFEVVCIRSHLSSVLKLIELPSEDTREVILRWFWSFKGRIQ